ncbi:16258_t:CDS:2 [Dentiscutata erythropus]|uniref:16258_t:CDS:1 n=1 Tax=Dentiscutata erythropus TaxID=1348616 RepID=A0A9N9A4B3_9GLOM|nr:16258_t:CDS:2 [Dentiscutata erythropus]
MMCKTFVEAFSKHNHIRLKGPSPYKITHRYSTTINIQVSPNDDNMSIKTL